MKFYLFLLFAVTTSVIAYPVEDPFEVLSNAIKACKNKKVGDACEYKVSCGQAIFL